MPDEDTTGRELQILPRVGLDINRTHPCPLRRERPLRREAAGLLPDLKFAS